MAINRAIIILLVLLATGCGLFNKKEKSANTPSFGPVDNSCYYVYDLIEAIECASVTSDIISYNDEWPANTSSTKFFQLIKGNKNLRSISFCITPVTNLPSSIGTLTNLEDLHLPSGTISSVPKEIGNLKKLKKLDFGNSFDECRGSPITYIPKEIGNCTSLEYLGLAFSKVSDLPKELTNCKALKTIDLSYNEIIEENTIIELQKLLPQVEIIRKQ